MRNTGVFISVLLTGALAGAVFAGAAGPAAADSPSPSDTSSTASTAATGDDGSAAPTEAGTSFRTATAFRPGLRPTADASTGDYLYWMFPVDVGQRATVTAEVSFPASSARKSTSSWQVDVYDGLRRRQPCVYGAQTKAVARDAGTVELRCTLRTVRAWVEPWSNDPLPGSYYVRLTAVSAQEQDLGLPMKAAIGVRMSGEGGAQAVGGRLAAPLTPGATGDGDTGDDTAGDDSAEDTATAPEDGWSSSRWSDRWLWTAGGGVLGALASIAGYSLARPSRRRMAPPAQY